jgi:hypothetical protein
MAADFSGIHYCEERRDYENRCTVGSPGNGSCLSIWLPLGPSPLQIITETATIIGNSLCTPLWLRL